jgi:excisionase family DNA binding protein
VNEQRDPHAFQLAFNVNEAALILRISPRTVRQLIARRELACFRVGRRVLVSGIALKTFVRARESTSP